MKEILLTSSALILALLVLRRIFRNRISCRVRYALWALVLVRLLVPVSLPAADFSVLSVSQPARTEVEARLEENDVYILPVREDPVSYASVVWPRWTDILPIEGHPVVSEDEKTVVTYAFTLEEALDLTWKTGMGCMALWLILSNLRFRRMLQMRRVPLEFPDCKRPVYLVEEGLASPCLFGLFKPAIYLTPAALESRESLRHILAHEESHARQGDPLWSLLRGVCLTVYWFDPLVWLAARAAKEDCELSCDELALKALGEEERVPYGRTLLRLIPVKRFAGGMMLTATTMTSDKKRLTERVTRIAENRKMKRTALCALLTAAAVVCAVTFTGCVAAAEPEPETPGAPADPAGDAAPVLTIPLTDLTPFEPAPVEVLPVENVFSDHHGEGHHQEHDERYRLGGGCHTTEHCGTFAWSCGGSTYVSSHDLRLSSYPSDYFLCFPEQEYVEEEFANLFGYDGVRIIYQDEGGSAVSDYYIFEEGAGGTEVRLLARMYGEPYLIDLDGDGTAELASSDALEHCQLVFRRDGQLYEADIRALVLENWPGTGDSTGFSWSPEDACLHIFYQIYSSDNRQNRLLRFDGENLLLYQENYRRKMSP